MLSNEKIGKIGKRWRHSEKLGNSGGTAKNGKKSFLEPPLDLFWRLKNCNLSINGNINCFSTRPFKTIFTTFNKIVITKNSFTIYAYTAYQMKDEDLVELTFQITFQRRLSFDE